MGIVLKRIYMENYKLFDQRTVTFSDVLTVFGGPNGYGKTSTFDAIELLITGDISRVYENKAIAANAAYEEQFLAKDQSRDVVIQGEFFNTDSEKRLVIIRQIPVVRKRSGTRKKNLNPRSIRGMVKTYFASRLELPPEQWEFAEEQAAKKRLNDFFGEQNIKRYTMLHYLRQENRLEFFEQTEDNRTKAIESLFGLKEYQEKLEQAESRKRKWSKVQTPLGKKIEKLREIINSPGEAAEQVEYICAANGVPAWDQEKLNFRGADSAHLHQELLNQVDGVEALIRHREEFAIDGDTRAFRGIPEEKRALAILAWKLNSEDPNAEKLRKRKEWQKFCVDQNEELKTARYTSVDWKTLCKLIGATELEDEFVSLAEQITKSQENQSGLERSMTELEKARNMLHNQAQKTDMLDTGTCPYCGQDWGSMEVLEEHFSRTKESLLSVLEREEASGVRLTEKCTELFQQNCSAKWDTLLNKLEQDVALQVFDRYPKWQDFCNAAAVCEPVMKRLYIDPAQIMLGSSLDEAILGISELLRQADALCTSLSAEYVAMDQRYGFRRLYAESFRSREELNRLTPEVLEQKRQYIRYQYYRSFDESREELHREEQKQDSLKKLLDQLDLYIKSLKKAINTYSKQLISQIEIPFFLYSSRLLQSYHGGQGILISTERENGTEEGAEQNKIRFTAPGKEHDVLYTMSSGQLSAVLLAFTLSLNQIYAGDGFRAMLIDDPIQCMDDINMVSLVELLGREFADSQIILSTHEDVFAKYIRYKYDRYGLKHKAVSLKDS